MARIELQDVPLSLRELGLEGIKGVPRNGGYQRNSVRVVLLIFTLSSFMLTDVWTPFPGTPLLPFQRVWV